MQLVKPQNLKELQHLTDYILKAIGDKRKATVRISARLRRFNGYADTPHYVESGRRIITISQNYLKTCKVKKLIKTLIHEISHFKYSKVQKLRKQYKKYGYTYFSRYWRKHDHTKAFKRLTKKLESRFWNNHKIMVNSSLNN